MRTECTETIGHVHQVIIQYISMQGGSNLGRMTHTTISPRLSLSLAAQRLTWVV